MRASRRMVSPGRALPRIFTLRSAVSLSPASGWDLRIALRHRAGQLRGGFYQQHSGEKRLAGKMSAQKRFVAAHDVFTDTRLARLQLNQTINKAKFRSVRQQVQRVGHRGHRLSAESVKCTELFRQRALSNLITSGGSATQSADRKNHRIKSLVIPQVGKIKANR